MAAASRMRDTCPDRSERPRSALTSFFDDLRLPFEGNMAKGARSGDDAGLADIQRKRFEFFD